MSTPSKFQRSPPLPRRCNSPSRSCWREVALLFQRSPPLPRRCNDAQRRGLVKLIEFQRSPPLPRRCNERERAAQLAHRSFQRSPPLPRRCNRVFVRFLFAMQASFNAHRPFRGGAIRPERDDPVLLPCFNAHRPFRGGAIGGGERGGRAAAVSTLTAPSEAVQ